MHFAHFVSPKGITLFLNGKLHSVAPDHLNFEKIKEAIQAKQYDDLEALIDVPTAMTVWANNPDFAVIDGRIYYGGSAFDGVVSDKVLRMIEEGMEAQPLLNFLRKARENPSASAQRELLLFCEANDFLIHEDGDIIAYKGVREDYTDSHSGTISNPIGAVVTKPRHEVDDRRDVTCSFGLHFAALGYAQGFGSRLMVIKVNPADVVAIPSDYHNQKGRCCRYEVIAEIEPERKAEGLPRKEVYTNQDLGFSPCSSPALDLPEADTRDEDDDEDDPDDGWDSWWNGCGNAYTEDDDD